MVHATTTISVLLVIPLLFISANGSNCTQSKPAGDCKCSFSNGTFIDLKLMNPKNDGKNWRIPYVKYLDFQYAFNPCYAMENLPAGPEATNCNKGVVCQRSEDEKLYYDLGNQPTEAFQVKTDGSVMVTYIGSDVTSDTKGKRKSWITLVCDESALVPKLVVTNAETTDYYFELTSKYCCLTSPGGGLSIGSILCILFVVILVIYLVVGVLFNKFARGATGAELIPNRAFWAALPGLIKEGFQFTAAKITGCFSRDAQYDQI